MTPSTKAMLFFNPKSGHSKTEQLPRKISAHFAQHNIDLETIVVPKSHTELNQIMNSAISDGVNLFVAAGGDGTVSMISTHLVGTQIPIGIIPLGTGNLLAKALDIPLKLEQALDLITSDEHETVKIDTFKMDHRHFLLNISVGVSPRIMESVDSDDKQRLGFFAYLINFIQQIFGLKVHRVSIDYDHQLTSFSASEILITNIGTAGVEPLTWSEDILLDDGTLDLLVFRAANIIDILGLVVSIFTKKGKYNPLVKFLKVTEYCRIESQTPLNTQADGDVIGDTPFEVHICPRSLTIIAGKNNRITHKGGV
jgi:YegS/Rv2252/BmrU family lipid kinase